MSPLMTWVVLPLVLSSCLYALLVGGFYFVQGRPGLALMYAGYVIANGGGIWDAMTFKACQ